MSREGALRYGWGGRSGDTCCPQSKPAAGLAACKPAGCPLLSASHFLPANPFHAILKPKAEGEGQAEGASQQLACECPAPQVCGG